MNGSASFLIIGSGVDLILYGDEFQSFEQLIDSLAGKRGWTMAKFNAFRSVDVFSVNFNNYYLGIDDLQLSERALSGVLLDSAPCASHQRQLPRTLPRIRKPHATRSRRTGRAK